MDGFGNEFFSSAAFAVDMDRRVESRNAHNNIQHRSHLGAAGDDIGEIELLVQKPLETLDLGVELAILQSSFDLQQQIAWLERFGKIAVGAAAHCLHRILNAAVRRQDDRRHFRVDCAELFHQRYAVTVGEHQIDDAKIEVPRLELDDRIILFTRSSHLVIRRFQPHFYQLKEICVIVDDQYFA